MSPRPLLLAVLLLAVATTARGQDSAPRPLAPMEREMALAERALNDDERQIAESHYRTALYAGWMLHGALAGADGRFADARAAFTRASSAIVDSGDALQSLASIDLQMNDAPAAVAILTKLTAARPRDAGLKRLLAQALVAAGEPAEAVQILEEAHGAAPDDLETTFALATGYLRLKKADAAARLFAQLAAARPKAETYVLIGRAYRDAGMYGQARTTLTRALTMNPRVRHANYYLGTVAVMEEGVNRLDEAIAAFRRELAGSPNDPATTRLLGIALVEKHDERGALPLLQAASRDGDAGWQTFHYLGRCQLALGRATDAVVSLRRALALARDSATEVRTGAIHYQLGQALRQAGETQQAEAEFASAAAASAQRTETDRDNLQRYLTDAGQQRPELPRFSLDRSAFAKASGEDLQRLQRDVDTALARVYLNLGIIEAQAARFARSADLLQSAETLHPTLPTVQYSLGVAAFNAKQYRLAAAALERALVADPGNADARRMLALASMNIDAFARAAELLRDDPQAQHDPSLQYAYGVALVHSGHAAEAERLFSTLLASHTDNPQLTVLLGEAHAEQGDYDGAIALLTRALTLKPDVPDANRTLGFIYMKQGRLPQAAEALRAELKAHPDDLRARYTLATVLDLDNQPPQALEELARVLQARPDDADARYLTGKILLARGAAAEAVEHLEIAARLAPSDANVHYQLGQAYQKLGRTSDAQKAFERFQQLKDQKRGGGA